MLSEYECLIETGLPAGNFCCQIKYSLMVNNGAPPLLNYALGNGFLPLSGVSSTNPSPT
jgi:hypothetical protein